MEITGPNSIFRFQNLPKLPIGFLHHLHFPRKKSALINDYENIIAYSEESKQNEVYANKCGLFQIHLGGLGISATSGKFNCFYAHLSLKTVFPALKLTQIVL